VGITERLRVLVEHQDTAAAPALAKLSGGAGQADAATQKLSQTATVTGAAFRAATAVGLGYAGVRLGRVS